MRSRRPQRRRSSQIDAWKEARASRSSLVWRPGAQMSCSRFYRISTSRLAFAKVSLPVKHNTSIPRSFPSLLLQWIECPGCIDRVKTKLESRFHCQPMNRPCLYRLLCTLKVLPHEKEKLNYFRSIPSQPRSTHIR